MRIARFLIAATAVLALAGCSKVQSDAQDFHDWWNSKPSHMGASGKWTPMGTGYFGQNAQGWAVLKPPAEQPPLREDLKEQPVPNTIVENYQAYQPGPAGSEPYNDSVSVYPLEQDSTGVMPHHIVEQQPMAAMPEPAQTEPMRAGPTAYGMMVQQIYFAHGSAHIGAVDNRALHVHAKRIRTKGPVAVTVVGHASHRVNTTDDPVRKKEINFEMAQKRADAVTNVLTSDGVTPSWVMAVSKGDDEPNPHRGKRSQEAADRRVELFVNKGQ
jgi:outer membrane protein OmpA-like peptidoglycan-associated protein